MVMPACESRGIGICFTFSKLAQQYCWHGWKTFVYCKLVADESSHFGEKKRRSPNNFPPMAGQTKRDGWPFGRLAAICMRRKEVNDEGRQSATALLAGNVGIEVVLSVWAFCCCRCTGGRMWSAGSNSKSLQNSKSERKHKRLIGLLQMHEKLLSEAPKRNVILKISKWNA